MLAQLPCSGLLAALLRLPSHLLEHLTASHLPAHVLDMSCFIIRALRCARHRFRRRAVRQELLRMAFMSLPQSGKPFWPAAVVCHTAGCGPLH